MADEEAITGSLRLDIEADSSGLSKGLSSVEDRLNSFAKVVSNLNDTLSKMLGSDLAGAFNKLTTVSFKDRIVSQFQAICNAAADAAEDVSTFARGLEEINPDLEALAEAGASIKGVGDAASSTRASVEGLRTSLGSLSDQALATQGGLDSLITRTNTLTDALTNAVSKANRLRSELAQPFGAFATGTEGISDAGTTATVSENPSAEARGGTTEPIIVMAPAEGEIGGQANSLAQFHDTMEAVTGMKEAAVTQAAAIREAGLASQAARVSGNLPDEIDSLVERIRGIAIPIPPVVEEVVSETPPPETPGGGGGGGGGNEGSPRSSGGSGGGGGENEQSHSDRAESIGGGWNMLFTAGAILTPFIEGAKAAADFNTALDKLYATAGETGSIEQMRQQLLQLSNTYGILPVKVADAMFTISSAGYKGAEGMTVLTAASRLARATQSDLGDVTNLVVKTLLTYQQNVSQAAADTDIYTHAIALSLVQGKEWVPGIDTVRIIARNAGLSIAETAAAFDVLTQHTKDASVAATYLKNFISGLVDPTSKMKEAAKDAGLEWLAMGEGAQEIKRVGLAGVLNEIEHATNGNVTALTQLFPDLRKNQSIMALLNDGGASYNRILQQLNGSIGETSAALKKQQQPLADLEAKYQVLLITLGQDLLPLMTVLAQDTNTVIDIFNQLPHSIQEVIVVGVALTGALMGIVGAGKLVGSSIAEVIEAFEELIPAAEGAEAAEEAVAATGESAFALSNPYMLAIAAVAIAVVAIATAWDKAKKAQEDYYNAQHTGNALNDAQQQLVDARKQLATDLQNSRTRQGGVEYGQGPVIGADLRKVQWAENDLNWVHKGNAQAFQSSIARLQNQVNADQARIDQLRAEQQAHPGRESSEWQNQIDAIQSDINDKQASIANYTEFLNGITSTSTLPTGSSGLSNSRILDALSQYKTDKLDDGIDKLAGCAEFVSRVLTKAGVDVQSSMAAGQLEHNVVAAGGSQDTKPHAGDVVFFHGKKWGAIKDSLGEGYHAGFVNSVNNHGIPEITSYNAGSVHTEHYSAADLAQATYYTLPDTSVLDLGAGITGAQPSWSTQLAKGEKKGKNGAPIAMMPKLLPLVLPSTDLSKAALDAHNYSDKMRELNDLLAQQEAHLRTAGQAYDDFGLKVGQASQRYDLATQAIKLFQAQLPGMEDKANAAYQHEDNTRQNFNTLRTKYNQELSAGNKPSQQLKDRVVEARQAFEQARSSLALLRAEITSTHSALDTAITDQSAALDAQVQAMTAQSQKAVEQFLSQQEDLLKAHQLTRAQYESNLGLATQQTPGQGPQPFGLPTLDATDVARINSALQSSQDTRAEASQRLGQEMLGLNPHDVTRLMQALAQEVQLYRDAGVNEEDVVAYENAKIAELKHQAFDEVLQDQKQMQESMLSSGQETYTQYENYLLTVLQTIHAQYGTSIEDQREMNLQIAQLGQELIKTDWQQAAQIADGFKQQLTTGKITLQQYIAELTAMQNALPKTSEEYVQLGNAVAEAQAKIQAGEDKTASKVSGFFNPVIDAYMGNAKNRQKSIHDAYQSIAQDFLKNQIDSGIKSFVLGLQQHRDRAAQDAANNAQARNPNDLANIWVVAYGQHVRIFTGAVAQFGNWVQRFESAVAHAFAPGGATGATGAISSSIGTPLGGGQGTNNSSTAANSVTIGNKTYDFSVAGQAASDIQSFATQTGKAIGGAATAAVAGHIATAAGAVSDAVSGVTAIAQGSSVQDMVKGASSVAGALNSVSTLDKGLGIAGIMAKVTPVLGAVSAAIGIISLFSGPGKQHPALFRKQQFSHVFNDFGVTAPSEYKGTEGLRSLLGPTTLNAAGVHSTSSGGNNVTVNIHPGAFQGLASPEDHGAAVVQAISSGIAQLNAIDQARRGITPGQ
jgi:TP901 family phage tail tape measure protein